jgi:hypothetical protein
MQALDQIFSAGLSKITVKNVTRLAPRQSYYHSSKVVAM